MRRWLCCWCSLCLSFLLEDLFGRGILTKTMLMVMFMGSDAIIAEIFVDAVLLPRWTQITSGKTQNRANGNSATTATTAGPLLRPGSSLYAARRSPGPLWARDLSKGFRQGAPGPACPRLFGGWTVLRTHGKGGGRGRRRLHVRPPRRA